MNQPAKIEFNVDEHYENEKGVFKVISISKKQMVIRWENGEEVSTNIELQQRIAERRQWEQANQPAKAKTAFKSDSPDTKTGFSGFFKTDFKNTASKTTWRSRNQLGKAITQKINTPQFKFNSWAFGHKPEMHVQDTQHHQQGANDFQAKFFVRLDPKHLYYGFRVVRPSISEGVSPDWQTFIAWLAQKENEKRIHTIALNNHLKVFDATGPLSFFEDKWLAVENQQQSDTRTLTDHFTGAPESEPMVLEFAVMIDKHIAIASADGIADQIAEVFLQLLPVYQAAAIH